MTQSIADLCDQYQDQIEIAQPLFRDFGGAAHFQGVITTLQVDRDFMLIKETLSTDGNRGVLLIDGDGAIDCALLGDRLAALACENNWSGIIINGCIRDSADVCEITIGVRALGTCPRKPGFEGGGQKNIPVKFAGLTFTPGDYIYADPDGIIMTANKF